MKRLDGKVAIVTGGSSGIGKAIAERFAKEGANVIITGRHEDTLKEVANDKISYVVGDMTDSKAVEKVISLAADKFGRIDILVNNAG